MVGRDDRPCRTGRRVFGYEEGIYRARANHGTQSPAPVCGDAHSRNRTQGCSDKQKGFFQSPEDKTYYVAAKEEQRPHFVLIEDATGMVKEAAFAAALLAALPVSAIAQSACGGPREMTVCEAELYDAGVTWEGRARETRAHLEGCMEKLRIRTSTVVNNLVIPPFPQPKNADWKQDATLLGLVATLGLGLGVTLGVFLGR